MIDRFERFSFAISEISRYWHKIAADVMEEHGLKGPYAVYFTTMYQYPAGITAARLAELCSRDKADVSRAVTVMEKKGLVEKEPVNQNQYRALLKLTEEGMALAEHINDKAMTAVDFGGQGVTPEHREIFYRCLETIAGNLQRLSKEGL
ncbi:MAG: MarR family transcriptional regulator [Oscillospiraceae bacterium]|nr:MarR family transcriptional regulator [Oscillospiraceae bacterium]